MLKESIIFHGQFKQTKKWNFGNIGRVMVPCVVGLGPDLCFINILSESLL